jgi:hypothetical protein
LDVDDGTRLVKVTLEPLYVPTKALVFFPKSRVTVGLATTSLTQFLERALLTLPTPVRQ